jgi:hypothetical protein
MLNIIIKNKKLIKFFKCLLKIFQFLNKYLYILSFLSLLNSIYAKVRGNKFYKAINWTLKLILISTLIVSTGLILYFIDFGYPINTTLSIYLDFIKDYTAHLINLWNDLINIKENLIEQGWTGWNKDQLDQMAQLKDQLEKLNEIKDDLNKFNEIKDDLNVQIKQGIKEGVKEVIDEALDKIQEDDILNQTQYYKKVVGVCGLLFLGYFIFVLPINPEDLTQYNWLNQSLIELKINIINYFSNPGTPPTNPPAPSLVSPTISESSNSIGQSTITPNTPIITNSNLSPVSTINSSIQTDLTVSTVDSSTQTVIDGITVSKLVETQNLLADVLPDDAQKSITKVVNRSIKNIID